MARLPWRSGRPGDRLPVRAVGEQTSLADRKRRAGQRMIVGFDGCGPPDGLRALCRETRPAGFILFSRNIEEPAQVRELNRELRSLVPDDTPPLLTVDQEGGRVQRIRATEWPPARWLGNIDEPSRTRRVYRAMADELRAMGFVVDWAPVADVDSNPANPVIGDRSFGRDPERVARHVVAAVEGLHDGGVAACAKHFPGHGDTAVDSHEALPVVEKDRPELEAVELHPFQAAVSAGVGLVMTAHVVYPAYDEHHPATMSAALIDGVLRRQLGFDGVVVSDDLEMKAVRGRHPVDMQLSLATRATVDLFLCCRDPELQWQVFETLVHQQEADPLYDDLAVDSVARLDALRRRFLSSPTPPPDLSVVGGVAHRDLALGVAALGRS
ncbi:MAG: beta-N-acetylhexosaminidase [Deltaproteobacteria bacterium]|nr:MAG: beta-N-acetylhexosaminidase [Deltaproteobacteria bacterium]